VKKSPIEEGRRWLEQAQEDLKGVELLLEGGSYHLVCFLAQQVAEKALKGFLYVQGEEVILGHSVEGLCRWAKEHEPDFEKLCQEIAVLDGYYLPTRYPNALPDGIPARVYNRKVAEEALRLARLTSEFVREKISSLEKGKD
jgi:HEPN domain-containing protein